MGRHWEEGQWRRTVKMIFMKKYKLSEENAQSITDGFEWEDWKDGYDPAEAVSEEVSCWSD